MRPKERKLHELPYTEIASGVKLYVGRFVQVFRLKKKLAELDFYLANIISTSILYSTVLYSVYVVQYGGH